MSETLRDYFALHAPEKPALWFESVVEKLPAAPDGVSFCESCKAGCECDQTLACIAAHEHQAKVREVQNRNAKNSYIQWRWAYAEAMIAERGK